MSDPQTTLVLTIDGLAARDLGAYGNTWLETPAFDRLASRALLIEHAIASSPDPEVSLDAMTASAGDEVAERRWLVFSDAPRSWQAGPWKWPRVERIDFEPAAAEGLAEAWVETHAAAFFAELVGLIEGVERGRSIWAHYSGLWSAWDAPFEWRQRLQQDEDPDPPQWAAPPHVDLGSEPDPDERLRLYQAFGGQVLLLDACLDVLLESLQSRPDVGELMLTSPRGYPLGEHGVVGGARPVLYSESIAVPLVAWHRDRPTCWRSQSIAGSSRVGGWLRAAGGEGGGRGAESALAERSARVFSRSAGQAAIRTPDWLCIRGDSRVELFVKPDDRWEDNDVSGRCPEIAQQLAEQAEAGPQPA